jgi:hypothetical protein
VGCFVTAPTREEVARGLIDRFNDDPSDGLDNSFGQAMRRCADYVLGLIRDETSELRTRVEALTRDLDAATARAERAVGLLKDSRDSVERDMPPDQRDVSLTDEYRLELLGRIDALLALGDAGGGV